MHGCKPNSANFSSFSGFGLRSVVAHAPGAYLASIHNNVHIQESTTECLKPYMSHSEKQLCSINTYVPNPDLRESEYSKLIDQHHFEYLEKALPSKSSKRLISCKAPHALAWLHAPP